MADSPSSDISIKPDYIEDRVWPSGSTVPTVHKIGRIESEYFGLIVKALI